MNSSKDKILYIDDEKENLTGFKYAFRKDYNVFVAASAEEGLEILSKEEIKVLITDQRMPNITGTQLLEKVAKLYPHIYRIILTAYTDVQDIIEAINLGKVYQYIRKPWDKEELKMVIDNALKSYELEKINVELISSLKQSNEQLEEVNNQLEEKVKERTKEIAVKNDELEKHRNHLEELVQKRTHELESAKEKAEESDRLKSSFLANVSHEIRTPMNAIVGFTELLMLDEYNAKEKREFKDNVVFNTEALLRLIDDILDISKIEANQLTINYEDHELNGILDELNYTFDRQLELFNKRHIRVIVDKPKEFDEFYISTDKVRLAQIITNLVGNAIKFTEDGHIKYGYTIVEEKNNKQFLQFFVEDTGIGISNDAKKIIFERFRKADVELPKLFRGAGLGLYIVKSLIDKYEGEIWLESEVNVGTCFYFKLPLIPAKSQIVKNNVEENQDINIDLSGKTIIISEEDDSNYTLIEKILQGTNANLVRAHGAKEVMEFFNILNSIDIILLQVSMTRKEALDEVKQIHEKNPEIPIVAEIAYTSIEHKNKALKAGCKAVLAKPFKSIDLLTAISNLLRKEEV